MGERNARRYFLTAEVFDADEALRIGMLSILRRKRSWTQRCRPLSSTPRRRTAGARQDQGADPRGRRPPPGRRARRRDGAAHRRDPRLARGQGRHRRLPREAEGLLVFARILIANRGEIACRVSRTARRLGVATVAVYSDADRNALHVRLADSARRIENYLDIPAVIAAARESGAQAIHPGYGFLAENAEFAAACRAAGIVFIGPAPEAIAAMGDKMAAKRVMEKAVPLVPGYHGERQEEALLEKEAARLGFPLLIKPAAGGGGKDEDRARQASFGAALQASKREAKSSFGDDRVLIERYLERPRHIEVQVFGDAHGKVVHLFERDCSVQRRHQKVVEEAPAPNFPRKQEIRAAAVAAAKAICTPAPARWSSSPSRTDVSISWR